jgi:hypothetical protein
MPNKREVIDAINTAITELNPHCQDHPLTPIGSIHDQRETCGHRSCMSFAGALLEAVPGGADAGSDYPIAVVRPPGRCPDKAFFHVTITGDPPDANHGFCVYFYGNSAIVIQVFLGKRVSMLRWLPYSDFIAAWGNLRSGKFVEAYNTLFRVTINPFNAQSTRVTLVDAQTLAPIRRTRSFKF